MHIRTCRVTLPHHQRHSILAPSCMHSVVNAASESKYELPLASMKPVRWLSGLANLFQCAITLTSIVVTWTSLSALNIGVFPDTYYSA